LAHCVPANVFAAYGTGNAYSIGYRHFSECLSAVAQVWPGARHDPDYQRLTEYLRKRSP